ncbi:MAG: hypothetical protein ABSF95_08025 [Verrucomicrobiota bacterium]|jgi:hypothetical protein
MSAVAQELIEIVEALPEEKAREAVDFARFLQQQASDLEWERIIGDARARPKLDAFVADALHEGPAEPLDPSRL